MDVKHNFAANVIDAELKLSNGFVDAGDHHVFPVAEEGAEQINESMATAPGNTGHYYHTYQGDNIE